MAGPGSGGRLIRPQIALIYQLDTVTTAADPDGIGPLTTGYDADLGDVLPYDVGTVRTSSRKEKTVIRLPVQIESETYDQTQQVAQGNTQGRRMTLITHFDELRKLSLIDADGLPMLYRGDRLGSIVHAKTGVLIIKVTEPHGLFIEETCPISFGLSGADRNLLRISLTSRAQGV
jgi:hypothetical protein